MTKPLFEKYADDYASSRPGYPSEIKDFLYHKFCSGPCAVYLDVACGTGIFTQLMAPEGCANPTPEGPSCMGIDWSLSLLKAGCDFYGGFGFMPVCARGEKLPIKSSSCDLVTIAQGFHWMHRHDSLAEIYRILKPGAGISLIWYRRKDLTKPHQAYVENLTRHYNPNYDPKFMDADYVGMLIADGRFTDIGQKRFYGSKTYDLETYIKWQRSKSFIGDAMEPDLLDEFLVKVEQNIPTFFPDGVIVEEFKYDVVWGRKV